MSPVGDRRPAQHTRVYKIVDREQRSTLRSGDDWWGAPIDHHDGFVHFSTHDQVMGTLRKHFAGARGLWILELAVERLDPSQLRWEPSRGGDLFPHLYGPMRWGMVVA